MPATFPTSPAFNEQFIPAPPPFESERADEEDYLLEYQKKLNHFLQGQYTGLRSLQNSVASGWLISTLRVLDLDADTITAGTIFTQDLYIGSDGNGSIGLLGTTTQIKITDEAGQDRFIAGDLGSGDTNWGMQSINAAGTVVFQCTDTVFMDGAIITDATLVGAKLVNATIEGSKIANTTITDSLINDMNGSKLATASVPNAAITSLSADKISLSGTLTCTTTGTAIDITDAGIFKLSSGGDIELKAAASGDINQILFKDSSGTLRGLLAFYPTSDAMWLGASGGDLVLDAGLNNVLVHTDTVSLSPAIPNDTDLGGSTRRWKTAYVNNIENPTLDLQLKCPSAKNITVNNHFRPTADSTFSCGTTGKRWLKVWADAYSDLPMRNAFVITEPDMVYKDMDRDSGLFIMVRIKHIEKKDWEWYPAMFIDRDGSIHCKKVVEDANWGKPDYPYRGSFELGNDFMTTNRGNNV